MKLALILAACSLSWGQVRAVVKPLSPKDTQKLMGSKDHTLWTVNVHSAQPIVRRGDVTALLSISELPAGIDGQVVIREADGNELNMAGRLWQKASPSIGDVALGFGLTSGSPWLIGIGAGVKFGNMIWDAVKGQAPDGAKISTILMPKLMECVDGDCGQYLLVTALDPGAKVFEVPALFSPNQPKAAKPMPEQELLFSRNLQPTSTHPPFEGEIIYDDAWKLVMFRSTYASRMEMEAREQVTAVGAGN